MLHFFSRLDSQSAFQMFKLFSQAAILVYHGGTPAWLLYTELCKFLRNISTNIWSLEKRTDLKLGEVSYWFIFNNITISLLFRFSFFIAWLWKRSVIYHKETNTVRMELLTRIFQTKEIEKFRANFSELHNI